MRSTVVFDMDGTLVDSTSAVPDSYIQTMSQVPQGGARLSRQDIFNRYHLGPPPNIFADLLGRPALDSELEHFHKTLARLAKDVMVYDGVIGLLKSLRARSLRLAVFTGADTRSAQTLLVATGLVDHFELILGSDLVGAPKPAPDGLHEVAARLEVSEAHCLYVGDSPLDIACAQAAGVRPIAAGWGHLFVPTGECAVASEPAGVLELI